MRSAVGAICILDFAVRVVAPGFFFAAVEDEPDFTGVTGFFACEEEVLVDFAGAFGFAAAEVGAVAPDCAPARITQQIHKPPTINSPPAARRIIVCVLTNAPR
jgi:hypothetical protein